MIFNRYKPHKAKMKIEDLLENLIKAIGKNPFLKEVANYQPYLKPVTDMWMEVSKTLSNKIFKLLF